MGCEMSQAMLMVGCGVGGQGQRDMSWRGWRLPIAPASRGTARTPALTPTQASGTLRRVGHHGATSAGLSCCPAVPAVCTVPPAPAGSQERSSG